MKVNIRYEFGVQDDNGDYSKEITGYMIANNIESVDGNPRANQVLQVTVNYINEIHDQSIFSDLKNLPEVDHYDEPEPEDIRNWVQCELIREGHCILSIWYNVTETETDVFVKRAYVHIWYKEIPLSEAEKMRALGYASLF